MQAAYQITFIEFVKKLMQKMELDFNGSKKSPLFKVQINQMSVELSFLYIHDFTKVKTTLFNPKIVSFQFHHNQFNAADANV